jgi:hypothetical protein
MQTFTRTVIVGLVAGLLLMPAAAAWAHTGTSSGGSPVAAVGTQEASVSGAVVDPDGQPLPGVTVVVINEETGLRRTSVSDQQGRYRMPGLPVGSYTVRASLDGFQDVESTSVVLLLGQEATFQVAMQVAGAEEQVLVLGRAPIIDRSSSEVAGNVSEIQIQLLPMKDRKWLDLSLTLPQTGQDAIRAVFYNSVNIGAGINFYSNGFIVDGVSNNWQQQGEPRQDFPQDAIAEFRVIQSNATARYGFAQGGYLSAVTKSGTNRWHGTAYGYFRDDALNAKTTFQKAKPDFSRKQFGGSLGGPIVQDKVFAFVSFEDTRASSFFTVNSGGAFPDEDGTYTRPSNNMMGVARVDHILNENHRYFLRFARQDTLSKFIGSGGSRARSSSFTFAAPRDSLVFGETWVIGDNAFNDFRFQWAKATYIGWPSVPGLRWTAPGEFPQERVDSIPDMFTRPSLRTGNQSSFLGPERHIQLANTLTVYTGDHDLSFGVDLTWILWQPDNVGIARQWTFPTDRPYDANDPTTFPTRFQQRLLPRFNDFPSTEHSVFVNDNWRVSDQVTLNLGLRYDWQTQVWNEDLLTRSQPAITVAGTTLRAAGVPSAELFPFYDNSTRGDRNNFGPRVGVTWDPTGEGTQVFRAAYGVYYNRYRGNGAPRNERNPSDLFVFISNPSYPDPYEGQDPVEFARGALSFGIQGNENRTPYTQQAAVGYSRQLGDLASINLDLTYANGYSQHTQLDANYFSTPANLAAGVRPSSAYGRISSGLTDGTLEYRAASVRFERRFADDWQLTASYTLSSAKNDSEGLPASHFDRAADFGYANSDRRHRFRLSGIAKLPWDIFFSGIVDYQSSLAVNVTAGRDLNGDAIGGDRPVGVTRNQGCRGLNLSSVNAWRSLNGLSPVSNFECPDFLTLDFVVQKQIQLGGSMRFDLVFQVFNALNRSNYAPPVSNSLSGLFGQSVAVAAPRQAEFALRWTF